MPVARHAFSSSVGTERLTDIGSRLAIVNGWTQVTTQEGGTKAGVQSVTGWVPPNSLAPMDRFPDNNSNYGLCGSGAAVTDTVKYQNCERATSRVL